MPTPGSVQVINPPTPSPGVQSGGGGYGGGGVGGVDFSGIQNALNRIADARRRKDEMSSEYALREKERAADATRQKELLDYTLERNSPAARLGQNINGFNKLAASNADLSGYFTIMGKLYQGFEELRKTRLEPRVTDIQRERMAANYLTGMNVAMLATLVSKGKVRATQLIQGALDAAKESDRAMKNLQFMTLNGNAAGKDYGRNFISKINAISRPSAPETDSLTPFGRDVADKIEYFSGTRVQGPLKESENNYFVKGGSSEDFLTPENAGQTPIGYSPAEEDTTGRVSMSFPPPPASQPISQPTGSSGSKKYDMDTYLKLKNHLINNIQSEPIKKLIDGAIMANLTNELPVKDPVSGTISGYMPYTRENWLKYLKSNGLSNINGDTYAYAASVLAAITSEINGTGVGGTTSKGVFEGPEGKLRAEQDKTIGNTAHLSDADRERFAPILGRATKTLSQVPSHTAVEYRVNKNALDHLVAAHRETGGNLDATIQLAAKRQFIATNLEAIMTYHSLAAKLGKKPEDFPPYNEATSYLYKIMPKMTGDIITAAEEGRFVAAYQDIVETAYRNDPSMAKLLEETKAKGIEAKQIVDASDQLTKMGLSGPEAVTEMKRLLDQTEKMSKIESMSNFVGPPAADIPGVKTMLKGAEVGQETLQDMSEHTDYQGIYTPPVSEYEPLKKSLDKDVQDAFDNMMKSNTSIENRTGNGIRTEQEVTPADFMGMLGKTIDLPDLNSNRAIASFTRAGTIGSQYRQMAGIGQSPGAAASGQPQQPALASSQQPQQPGLQTAGGPQSAPGVSTPGRISQQPPLPAPVVFNVNTPQQPPQPQPATPLAANAFNRKTA